MVRAIGIFMQKNTAGRKEKPCGGFSDAERKEETAPEWV